MKVYTGGGDDGTTGLLFGGRVPKYADEPDAYGTVDEAVAALGFARAHAGDDPVGAEILHLQRQLFVLGAELATSPQNRDKLDDGATRVSPAMCDDLKARIDAYEARLPELTEFVIPGANGLSAALDLARTVIRRAERRTDALAADGRLDNPAALQWLNRLSDLVFLMARAAEPESLTLHDTTAETSG
jgi:cob(I)alamin adenosyltransferase